MQSIIFQEVHYLTRSPEPLRESGYKTNPTRDATPLWAAASSARGNRFPYGRHIRQCATRPKKAATTLCSKFSATRQSLVLFALSQRMSVYFKLYICRSIETNLYRSPPTQHQTGNPHPRRSIFPSVGWLPLGNPHIPI